MNRSGSAAEAIGPSIDHVKTMLFRPFDLGRWFILGFVTFLAYLLEGGGFYNFNNSFRGLGRANGGGGDEALETIRGGVGWIAAHEAFMAFVLFAVILFVLVVTVFVQWLQSRGTFMYIDCIATNRAEVARPWREHRDLADSFFFWRLVFSLIAMFIAIVLAIPLLVALFTALKSDTFSFGEIFGSALVLLTLPLLLLNGLAAALIQVSLRDFVAPVMYLRRIRCSEAWGIVLGMMRGSPGAFIVYFLLKIVLAVVIGVCTVAAGCLTCCVGFCCMAIPYIGRVFLQPVFVFKRSFSLFFLQGFGPEFDVFGPGAPGGGLPRPPQPSPYAPYSSSPAWPSSSVPSAPSGMEPGMPPSAPRTPASFEPSSGRPAPEPPLSIPLSEWPAPTPRVSSEPPPEPVPDPRPGPPPIPGDPGTTPPAAGTPRPDEGSPRRDPDAGPDPGRDRDPDEGSR